MSSAAGKLQYTLQHNQRTDCLLQAQTAECLVVGEIAVGRMAVVLNKCDLVSCHVLRTT